ncbi:Probable outer membrane protein precursor [Flavobacterium indicum GPTSA100-9 = DSM 17447]|uniref:Probable outer membrane protein n=2 Tax=Flavobacterium TaxID=237 RepID=H8XUR3_FLAIG|nr:Probable outer membrane protein precursor [Flavobacterium indicum GPTSA100-9 = DSM 17447]
MQFAWSQKIITGKVVNEKDMPLSGVNVYIEGTYDGNITDEKGEFVFTTEVTGKQILKVTLLGYETLTKEITIENYSFQSYRILQSVNTIEAVVISAGTIKAGDNSKISTLKPMDIVTTAGAVGDIVGALETMPGVNAVGESGRLFVRGGEAGETQTFVDGIRVAQPYGASPGNVPTRGRFSPFLFKGITFSTGGYSAEFGDALSSVLLLNTIDEPTQNQTDISIMSVGAGLGKTKKWTNNSLTINTSYINLQPYYNLAPQNLDWNKAPQTLAGEAVFRQKFKKGLLKVYTAYDFSEMNVNQKDINFSEKIQFGLTNKNLYSNASFKGNITDGLQVQTGLSFGFGTNQIGINFDKINNVERALHYKFKLRQTITGRIKWLAGTEFFHTNFDEKYTALNSNGIAYGYQNNSFAYFTELEVFLSTKLAFNAGLRSSNATVVGQRTWEPRASIAYKMAAKSQLSLAYGNFNQLPNSDYLKFASTPLEFEKTNHYILNYLYNDKGKMFRAEAYYKDYDQLIKYNTSLPQYNSNFSNSGTGYAKGIDLFWRDSKTVKNLDYWITYSFIDSKRDYRNYETQATPTFVANHNFSLVTKYFIEKWKSQLGTSYTFNSGRPYDNPNEVTFMNGKTKCYNNLSLSWAYLLSQQKILFFSITNVIGSTNVFGYQYANVPDSNGIYQRQPITQAADRFFFVGFFWTISDSKKENQLNQL